MDQQSYICFSLLAAVLSSLVTVESSTDSDHNHSERNLLFDPAPASKYLEINTYTKSNKPHLASSDNGRLHSLLVNLDIYRNYKTFAMQNKGNDLFLTQKEAASIYRIISDDAMQVRFLNSIQGHTNLERKKKIRSVSKNSPYININGNMWLNTVEVNTDPAEDPCRDVNGLLSKSLLDDCSDDNGDVKRHGEDKHRTDKQAAVKKRFSRGIHRGGTRERDSFWIDEGGAYLPQKVTESSSNIPYNNMGKWLEPLAVNGRVMGTLLHNRDVPDPVGKDGVVTNIHTRGKSNASDKEADPDSVNGDFKDFKEADRAFLQQPEMGDFYYDSAEVGDLNKRGNYKGRIYALLKQNPRQSPRVSLQESPSLRIHDKIERSQHKKPLRQIVTTTKDPVCEPERDGTMPMSCPSNSGTCLYDAMICDGTANCPQGEDETFSLCVLRHWGHTWTFTKAQERKIMECEMRCLKKVVEVMKLDRTMKWFKKLLPTS